MRPTIKVYRETVRYFDDDGELLDIAESLDAEVEVIEPDEYDLEDGIEMWAVDQLSRLGVHEPSQGPLRMWPGGLPERAWLSETYDHPYENENKVIETNAYLEGVSDLQRLKVFREVVREVTGVSV